MKKLMKKIFAARMNDLETIEEKSFWVTAPLVAIIGIAGLFTSGTYDSAAPTMTSAVLCLIFPLILMFTVYKTKNYHVAYPLLCIIIGGIAIPVTFIFSGGFLSGMPLFCSITTILSALCYSQKARFISFVSCVLGNTIAFIYVYYFGTPFPLSGTEEILVSMPEAAKAIYKDVMFGYYFSASSLFTSLFFITNDIRKYKFNQDALQQFFDSQKRKEILEKFKDQGLTLKSDHKNAVILFADISNFTPITEKMSSEKTAEFLNEFFTVASKYIHETGGIIDKYIGDCIMAYWIDSKEENCVLNAVKAMLNLKLDVYGENEKIYNKYGTELNFSVGIAYGDVIFGDIGSDSMHDYTVIGDAVNTANRIQDFATSGEMLISGSAANKIKDSIILETVETEHFFKGKNKSTDLYRIIGIANQRQEKIIADKIEYGYDLYICGCRGSFPVSGVRFSEYGGETSCYVIKKDDYALIVDCGTGLKNAMTIIEDCKDIDILLTHVHYDHILGLLMSKFPSDAKIRIFGRFDDWNKNFQALETFMKHPYWPIEIMGNNRINVELEKEIILNKDIVATFYSSDHPDDACVIKVMLKDKKVAFLADCENAEILNPSIALDAELVFFDGMFDDSEKEAHKGWGHGTWQDGVRYLEGRNIRKMVITHHNPELGDHSLMLKEKQAREMNSKVSFAKSGDIFTL